MELINIYLLPLLCWILSCIWVIVRYYKKELGVFQAPFIFALASLLMMLPQYSVIIYNPFYNPNLLWDLTFCMITDTLAFSYGWEKSQKQELKIVHDIQMKSSKYMFIIMFFFGLYCTMQGLQLNLAGDFDDIRENHSFQILNFFKIYLDFGLFFALTYISKDRKVPMWIWMIVIIGLVFYSYIILVMARRAITVKVVLAICLLLSFIKPTFRKKIKIVVLLFFTIGTVYQASISSIRYNLKEKSTESIDFWDNYKQSYIAPNLVHGMDLGNGAELIRYTKLNSDYNYGLLFWDDIVTWYFPSFIFGKEGKEQLKFTNPMTRKYIENICHGVTTQTGYYQAFSMFGYLGFIVFFFLGRVLGYVWKRQNISSLYLIVYLCFMYNIPNLSSHGFSYIVGQFETFIIFCLPLISYDIYKKRVNAVRTNMNIK